MIYRKVHRLARNRYLNIDHVRVQLNQICVKRYLAIRLLRRAGPRRGWRWFLFFRFRMHQDERQFRN